MYENKISARQLRRMIFIETFGAGALSVPMLACYKGQSGFWSLLFYGIFLAGTVIFFVAFSGKISEPDADKESLNEKNSKKNSMRFVEKSQGFATDCLKNNLTMNGSKDKTNCSTEFFPQPVKIVYTIRFFINAAAIFYFFGKTIQMVYMPESGFLFIIFPAAILLGCSLYTTLQKRARFLELIFPWIITVYCIAVILSFIGIEGAMQIGDTGKLWQGIFSDNLFRSMGDGYLLLLCSSPIEFLLFLRPAAELQNKKNKVLWGIITAVAGAFLCNMIFCFLAVRTLGPVLTGQSAWSVIKMMQLIRMPGGFLERFDILPVVFWILCMVAVLSGYLYYGWRLCQGMIENHERNSYQKTIENYAGDSYQKTAEDHDGDSCQKTAENHNRNLSQNMIKSSVIIIIGLLLFSCLMDKNTFLWTACLKYKIFVDFPLSFLLPIIVCIFKKKKEKYFNYQEKINENTEESTEEKRSEKNKQTEYFAGIAILIIFSVTFSLTGCQRLTDVEEKNYILSMYVDYPSDEEKVYEFWLARANLKEMEVSSDEIPCQITKIKARNLQELEEKYLETVPGKTEWNHIYTIFLGPGMEANKEGCNRLLKEWDNEWQKSPNVLLALCPETPEKLYKIKKIPAGAAGQEASLLAEQNKEKYLESICETPIDYLRARQQKADKIALYRVLIENGRMKITRGVI